MSRDYGLYLREKDVEECLKASMRLVEWMKREQARSEAMMTPTLGVLGPYLTSEAQSGTPKAEEVA